jgi:NAD+--asparagine ADP-ribosyltransferase
MTTLEGMRVVHDEDSWDEARLREEYRKLSLNHAAQGVQMTYLRKYEEAIKAFAEALEALKENQ